MADDSLFAWVRGEWYRVAVSDIEHVWVERLDRRASALVVIGVGLTIYGLIYLFNSLKSLGDVLESASKGASDADSLGKNLDTSFANARNSPRADRSAEAA